MGTIAKDEKYKACRCTGIVLVVLGIVCLVVGAVIFGIFPPLFKEKVQDGLILKRCADLEDRFLNPPAGNTISYYVYNVTNMEEVNLGTAEKPILEEIGPFVFKQRKNKEGVIWDKEAGKVTYNERTRLEFDEELSKFSLDVEVNHVNLPDIVLAESLFSVMNGIVLGMAPPPPGVIGGLVVTHTVSELLYNGYKIGYLDYLEKKVNYVYKIVENVVQSQGKELPPNNTFAVFLGKLDSVGEDVTIFTGEKGMENYAFIDTYGGEDSLHFWRPNTTCNDINGTDGTQFPPDVVNDTLYVFSSDVCRSLMFQYEQEVKIKKITARRYTVPEEVFADPNEFEPNKCFCPVKKNCTTKAGLIPLEACRGAPLAMSAPHFYMGDLGYVEAYVGQKPEKSKHETFLDVEPITGTVIRGSKKLQVNVMIKPNKISITQANVTEDGFFPLLWLEEAGVIDEANAEFLLKKVINMRKAVEWSAIGAMALGSILIILGIVIFFLKSGRSPSYMANEGFSANTRQDKSKLSENSSGYSMNSLR